MKRVYLVEIRPEAKHYGLKCCIGHRELYFDKPPSKKVLVAAMKQQDKNLERELKKMGLEDREGKEDKIFEKVCYELAATYGVPTFGKPWHGIDVACTSQHHGKEEGGPVGWVSLSRKYVNKA